MTTNLKKLTETLREDSLSRELETELQARRQEIIEALRTKGEYILRDQKGHTLRIATQTDHDKE